MVKKLPRFGVYVLLIFHTLKSFLRFSPIFFMFLMPFVVVFYVHFNDNRGLLSFFQTFIRAIVMMIGELEYQDSIASKATTLSNIVFCLFLLIVTIFLMNLLIGLAVSDTSAMLEKSSRMRIKLQIQTIQRTEIDLPQPEPLNNSSDFDAESELRSKENSVKLAEIIKKQKQMLQVTEKLQQRIDYMLERQRERHNFPIKFVEDEDLSE
uniref:Ion transport domain-containing protein n=1 Tax=Panagrolaimus sp. PS1159 TaxID=55785 RepID=A0AC35GXV9_9BILA